MKLYATVSSERASKGQGGNKHLDVVVQADDDRREVFYFTMTVMPDATVLCRLKSNQKDRIVYEEVLKLKGEKQKA